MPRPESHIREGDIYKVTRQHAPGSGAPLYSYVCRLADDNGDIHTFIGMDKNPGQIARFLRYALDNPPPPPEPEETE